MLDVYGECELAVTAMVRCALIEFHTAVNSQRTLTDA